MPYSSGWAIWGTTAAWLLAGGAIWLAIWRYDLARGGHLYPFSKAPMRQAQQVGGDAALLVGPTAAPAAGTEIRGFNTAR